MTNAPGVNVQPCVLTLVVHNRDLQQTQSWEPLYAVLQNSHWENKQTSVRAVPVQLIDNQNRKILVQNGCDAYITLWTSHTNGIVVEVNKAPMKQQPMRVFCDPVFRDIVSKM